MSIAWIEVKISGDILSTIHYDHDTKQSFRLHSTNAFFIQSIYCHLYLAPNLRLAFYNNLAFS